MRSDVFAPKRSPEDWIVIDQVKEWARSEVMKADLEPFLRHWFAHEPVAEARIGIRELAVSTGYAELDRERGTIVADGTIWLDIVDPEGRPRLVKRSTELRFEFGRVPDGSPTLVSASIGPVADTVDLPADFAT